MQTPEMFGTRSVAPDTESFVSYFPLPGFGILPVNAFLIRAAEPVLIDTGVPALREKFLSALSSAIDPTDIRWIVLTHTDPDHIGSLPQMLALAPNAKVVTTYLGLGKLSVMQIFLERFHLLNPGQRLDVGDRELVCIKPAVFDAPETTSFFDTKSRAYFSADSFGALMKEPAERADLIAASELRDGAIAWATIDAPWLTVADAEKFNARVAAVAELRPSVILSNHLPPARGMDDTLIDNLNAALRAPAFVGPDQSAIERMAA